MAKQYLKINDFSGGAVDAYDPRDLQPNQFSKVENLMLDKRSSLSTFGGEKEHQDVPSGDEIVICPGYGLYTYDTDHMKGDVNDAKARDEGENWMAVTDAITGTIDLFDLSNGSVLSEKIALGKPRGFSPGTYGSEARIQVINTTATAPSSASAPFKSDTIFLNMSGGHTANFKFPDGQDSTWSFKAGDIISISGHADNYQNNVNAVRIKSLTPATTYSEDGSSYIDVDSRTFTGQEGEATPGNGWLVYDPDSDGHSISVNLNAQMLVTVADGNPTTYSGAKLYTGNLTSYLTVSQSNLGKPYVVSAMIKTASGTRDDVYFRLGNATSNSFSINTTAKFYTAQLNPSSYSTYDDGIGFNGNMDIDISEGLVIYSTADDDTNWIIDDINVTRDGVFMQFEQRVLYRTDVTGLTGGEYGQATTALETGDVALTLLPKTVFHFVDEALRISDATLSTGTGGTSPPKNKWWGYIKRIQFDIANMDEVGEEPKRVIDGWFSSDNDLPAPTDFGVVDYDDSSTLTYPTAGAGFDINVHDLATAHNDNFGTWLVGDYECVLSFIYDSYIGSSTAQESLLYPTTSYSSFSVAADSSFLTIEIGAESDADGTDRYDERLSGGRVYARKKGSDDDWQLLCEIDIRRGARAKPFGEFTAWVDGAGANQAKVSAIYSLDPNIDTYETLNGFSQNEKKVTISGEDEGYKSSVIANRRCFVANVKTQNNDGETIQMRDRIMYSPINRFDIFPRSFVLDTVKGDAEEYVDIEEYADRLLAFKQRRLHIINIQDPSPANWFIEDVKDYAGIIHHSAAAKTEMGVVWVNKEGCHLYDCKGVKNLIFGKIAESTWENFVTIESSIFYHPQKYYVCVLADYFGGDNNIYLYDFRTKSWIKGSSTFADNQNRTNFVEDWNGNPAVIYQPLLESDRWELIQSGWEALSSTNQRWDEMQTKILMPREWSDDLVEHQPNTIVLQTKDYDFGEPGFIKKVYSVTLTYASDTDMSTPISYALDGSGSFDGNTFTGDFSGSGTGWKQLRATLSSPVECQSIALKISNTNTSGTTEGLKINDITLEYRTLRKRVS